MLIPLHIVAYKTAGENCDRALMNRGKHRGVTSIKKLAWALEKYFDDDEPVDDVRDALIAHLQAAVATVVFSAVTLESFINDFAVRKLKRQTKAYNDLFGKNVNSSPQEKWRRVPRLVTSRGISETSLASVQRTFRVRNALMHYKAPEVRYCAEEVFEFVYAKQAAEAFASVEITLRELGKLDPSEKLGWLNTTPRYLRVDSAFIDKLIRVTGQSHKGNSGFLRRR